MQPHLLLLHVQYQLQDLMQMLALWMPFVHECIDKEITGRVPSPWQDDFYLLSMPQPVEQYLDDVARC